MPTQTIPMLSKTSKIAYQDLHKTGLGFANPWYGKKARLSQPSLYYGEELLKPVHPKPLVHDSEETTALSEVSRATMSKKPGHVQPINYDKLNALYSQFVPQKELSHEQVYWQSPADVSTPTTHVKPFVKTRPAPIRPLHVTEAIFERIKMIFEGQITPFFEWYKQRVLEFYDAIVKEVSEYKGIFDELETEYENTLLAKKKLQIANKNLLIQNDTLLANGIQNDVCAIVLTYDHVVAPTSDSSICMFVELQNNCDRENNREPELEA
nr:hypothetical protein [Tanacetum cinerariifolium]